jgi:hypothetical protein
LPFIDDHDCALGIAVKSYLDELASHSDPTNVHTRERAKAKAPAEWFLHSVDVIADLNKAFRLWDAVSSFPFFSPPLLFFPFSPYQSHPFYFFV